MTSSRLTPIERILQSQGFGSRKACAALVTSGRVTVNGTPCVRAGTPVSTDGLVLGVDGQDWPWHERLYLALNKPAGVECSHSPQHHQSVFSLLPPHFVARGVQAAGRLDADTTGLLLLSDDGPWLHALASPRRHVQKTYRVTVKHPLDASQCARLLEGVVLHDDPEPVAALACVQQGEHVLDLVIDQGKYHQVKRMLAAVGNRVDALYRIGMGGLRLDEGELATLAEGEWRILSAEARLRLLPTER